MKHYKTEQVVKQVEETKLIKITCDKCGEEIKKDSRYNAYQTDWFEFKTGHSYPEGGSGEAFRLDLHETCSKELVNLLIDNGYKVREEEWDW